ncbi:MAG: hypothetical protein ACLSTO_06645 [Bilophila wadsworthia]
MPVEEDARYDSLAAERMRRRALAALREERAERSRTPGGNAPWGLGALENGASPGALSGWSRARDLQDGPARLERALERRSDAEGAGAGPAALNRPEKTWVPVWRISSAGLRRAAARGGRSGG